MRISGAVSLRRGEHGEVGKRPGGEVEDDAVGIDGRQPAALANGELVAPHGLVRGDHVVSARLEQFPERPLAWRDLGRTIACAKSRPSEKLRTPTVAMLAAPRRAAVSDFLGQSVPLLSRADAGPQVQRCVFGQPLISSSSSFARSPDDVARRAESLQVLRDGLVPAPIRAGHFLDPPGVDRVVALGDLEPLEERLRVLAILLGELERSGACSGRGRRA